MADRIREPNRWSVGNTIAERYELLEQIGKGGMGAVFRARDLVLDRIVAIKTVSKTDMSDDDYVRFHREAKAASTTKHKNLVETYDFGTDQSGQPYMVMELLEGINLKQCLSESDTGLDLEDVVLILIQICEGVRAIHESAVVHRDLKASNIMLLDGQVEGVRLLDFGLARDYSSMDEATLTKLGDIVGTPKYLSPEQAQGLTADERSDIYSIGCIAFEMLTGRPPFEGATAIDTIQMHISHEPPDLKNFDVPPDMEALVLRMLAKDPEERFQSATAIIKELENIRLVDRSDGSEDKSMPPARAPQNLPLVICLAAILTVSVASIAFISLTQTNSRAPSEDPGSNGKVEENEGELNEAEDLDLFISETQKNIKPNSFLFFNPADGLKLKSAVEKGITVPSILVDCELTDEQVSNLVALNPSWIALKSSNISDRQLEILSKARALKQLRIFESSSMTADGIKYLKDLPELRYLSIRHCDLTDEAMAFIAQIRNLSYLDVEENPRITKDGLSPLGRCKNLKVLALYHTGVKLEKDEAEKLKKRLGLRVVWNTSSFTVEEGLEAGKYFREETGLLRKVSGLNTFDIKNYYGNSGTVRY